MSKLTIITPTYNRAHTLPACFESIKSQTCKDFQWIIVDDGSTDSTKELVKTFIDSNDIGADINYIYKENGGKHTALNEAHPYINGEYVMILDSDDKLTKDAVSLVIDAWNEYGSNPEVGMLIFYKCNSEDQKMCYVKHPNMVVDTLREKRICSKSRDCCDTYRTDLFKKFKFPVFPGERFIGEGAAFLNIELASKGVYVDKAIYICDYLTDGLTVAGRKMRLGNPNGGRYNSKMYMNKKLPLGTRIKNSLLYVNYSMVLKINLKQIVVESGYTVLTAVCLVPGIILYIYWMIKYGRK